MESSESTSFGSTFDQHQHQQEQNHHHHQYKQQQQNHFDKNLSRRSVDWRDSGIVIDDDFRFNSSDLIPDLSRSKNGGVNISLDTQSASSIQCPFERIVYDDQDDDGDTILHLAVVGCSVEKVKDLIQICDLNAINNMMQTPLHVAALANRPEMIELLLKSCAKLDVHDRRGNTPLHLSCQKGYRNITAIILEYLSNNCRQQLQRYLALTNFDGQTCLHLAALYDRREIIELLVNVYDADLNCPDSRSGDTIMHKAIMDFNVDLVAFILGLNKHCNQSDFSGRKPLDTINILQESKIDKVQFELLARAKKLIEDRILACIDQNGCCTSVNGNRLGNNSNTQILDSSSSSSSDYSESDCDMS